MITAGIDIGSLTAKALILNDREILSHCIIPTGADTRITAQKTMNLALERAGLSLQDIGYIVSTGYGRVLISFANSNLTEISCHAKGAHWLFPTARTVLDMGGQDCKAISVNDKGQVTNFHMNDKCAAGTGRFMEVMAKALELPLEDIGELSLHTVKGPCSISSVCTVFAKTEALALLRRGAHKNDILAGTFEAFANRVFNLLSMVEIQRDFVISGGIAKNIGMVRRLEKKVGFAANIPFEPQIVGALGAAVLAKELGTAN
jgi:predicted CoA-substrate-specific enzyme activase